MPIVDHGRSIAVVPNGKPPSARIRRVRYYLDVYRKDEALRVTEDMRVLREHFGLNNVETLRLALHLSANAVREDRAKAMLP